MPVAAPCSPTEKDLKTQTPGSHGSRSERKWNKIHERIAFQITHGRKLSRLQRELPD
jgi:hypothetical protein